MNEDVHNFRKVHSLNLWQLNHYRMKKHVLFLFIFPIYSLVFTQSVPGYVAEAALEIKNPGKFLLDEFVRIEGGSFIMQGNTSHSIPLKSMTLMSFYLQDREVTNLWYKLFL